MIVRYSAPYVARMAQIAAFLKEADASPVYRRLLDDISGIVIPNLNAFPLLGKPYFEGPVQSTEALMATAKLPRDANKLLRKYIHDDFVILYAVLPDAIHLISIRHHRESTFNP
jgi:ParE toxin of type II toxin-antitoxin system, parDE